MQSFILNEIPMALFAWNALRLNSAIWNLCPRLNAYKLISVPHYGFFLGFKVQILFLCVNLAAHLRLSWQITSRTKKQSREV